MVALSAVPPHWPSLGLFAGLAAIFWLTPIRPSSAQDGAAKPALPTWAVTLNPLSRCASDPDFAAELAGPIPMAQRAPPAEAELVAEVNVARDNGNLAVSIHVFDRVLQSEAGARVFELPLADCHATADAISLVIAVLVEAGRTAPAPVQPVEALAPPPPPPPPEEPSEAPTRDAQPGQREAVETERKRYAWLGPKAGHDLTVQAGVGWGLLPGAHAGGTVGWGIRGPRVWPIWLSGTGYLPRSDEVHAARFAAAYGGIAVCPVRGERGAARGQICPNFSAGVLWAEGQQLPNARNRTEAIALVGLEIKGDFRLFGPLAFSLTGRAEVPLLRQKFAYKRLGGETVEIHQVAPLTLTFLGGLSLLFR